jgi:hypothetical protein
MCLYVVNVSTSYQIKMLSLRFAQKAGRGANDASDSIPMHAGRACAYIRHGLSNGGDGD